nr:MAG TPA: hypothetical protein [Caudoviricetes sp.]
MFTDLKLTKVMNQPSVHFKNTHFYTYRSTQYMSN